MNTRDLRSYQNPDSIRVLHFEFVNSNPSLIDLAEVKRSLRFDRDQLLPAGYCDPDDATNAAEYLSAQIRRSIRCDQEVQLLNTSIRPIQSSDGTTVYIPIIHVKEANTDLLLQLADVQVGVNGIDTTEITDWSAFCEGRVMVNCNGIPVAAKFTGPNSFNSITPVGNSWYLSEAGTVLYLAPT